MLMPWRIGDEQGIAVAVGGRAGESGDVDGIEKYIIYYI